MVEAPSTEHRELGIIGEKGMHTFRTNQIFMCLKSTICDLPSNLLPLIFRFEVKKQRSTIYDVRAEGYGRIHLNYFKLYGSESSENDTSHWCV